MKNLKKINLLFIFLNLLFFNNFVCIPVEPFNQFDQSLNTKALNTKEPSNIFFDYLEDLREFRDKFGNIVYYSYSNHEEIKQLKKEVQRLKSNVNNLERRGIKVGLAYTHNQPARGEMQDNHDIKFNHISFFAVYDGHGLSGEIVSNYLKEHLYNNILSDQSFNTNIPAAINSSFAKTDEDIKNEIFKDDESKNSNGGGSTATTALIKGNKIYIANVGDSRTIVLNRNGELIFKTEDHKPNSTKEMNRILQAEGRVINDRYGIPRVEGFALSRAFGDHFVFQRPIKHLIISTPDIEPLDLTSDVAFLVLACDGLWDVVSSEQAGEIVNRAPNVQAAAEELVKKALSGLPGPDGFMRFCMDNISVLVVDLRDYMINGSPRSQGIQAGVSQTAVPLINKSTQNNVELRNRMHSELREINENLEEIDHRIKNQNLNFAMIENLNKRLNSYREKINEFMQHNILFNNAFLNGANTFIGQLLLKLNQKYNDERDRIVGELR
ncbi:protein phosphatase 2C domain-containing protein [Candidatus Babeliales bacterium]|nr:protein phosphatase 2C domain-containing protein [Candidatus Babeliales bacterium]MCF7899555.1 protein phosphatase 2C domain-containing protein [Candidatus Babeliales bacterium]